MKKTMKVMLAGAAVCLMASSAWAVPVLTISDGTPANTYSVTDNGAGDENIKAGVVMFNGDVGDWIVNVTTGITQPVLGSDSVAVQDLNSVNVSGSAGGTLTITFFDDEYTLNPEATGAHFSIGGTTLGTVAWESYINEIQVATFSFTATPQDKGFSYNKSLSVNTGNSFSMTQVIKITHTPGQFSSMDATATVPEPGTLLLLGTGLLGLGLLRRRSQGQA